MRQTRESVVPAKKQAPSTATSAPESGAGRNTPEFSVSDLSGAIKRTLEDGFGYVRLRGEVSGYRGPHASGHCYFALKDEKAKIDAIVWRGVFGKLKVKPEEGMEVIAQGRVTSYPNASKYQIVIERLEPAGLGALMALLEERKRKFAAEGLFEDARKKPVPFLPRRIGIITSPTGAVIRDMMAGFHERFPASVIVWPVRVQGETSGDEVAAAVRGFNSFADKVRPDLLIVARGGGSLEDLWGFNDEAVVRAVSESDIPVISAVGHETDWTLVDLVADARAPTPTKAAEWSVPKYDELIEQLGSLGLRLSTTVRRQLDTARTHLKAAGRGLPTRDDLLAMPRQRFDAVDKRLGRALLANTRAHHTRQARVAGRLHVGLLSIPLQHAGERLAGVADRSQRALAARVQIKRQRLNTAEQLLRSMSYQSVLARGFALVRDDTGAMVRSVNGARQAKWLDVEFHDGRAQVGPLADGGSPRKFEKTASASSPTEDGASSVRESRARSRRKTPSGTPGEGQGDLF